MRVPWTARRSNQSILKEIKPEYLLEGLMLKLKLQYFGHMMGKADSLGKKNKKTQNLMLGNTVGKKRRGWWRKRWLDSITNSVDINLSILLEIVKDMEAWHTAVHRVTRVEHDLVTEQKQDECVFVFIHEIHLYPQNLLPYPLL